MNQPLHRRRIIQLQALGIGAALLAATIATPVSASEPSSQPANSAAAEELKALRAEVSQVRAEVKDLKQTGRQETATRQS